MATKLVMVAAAALLGMAAAAPTSHAWSAPAFTSIKKRAPVCDFTVDGYTQLRPSFLPSSIMPLSSVSSKPDCYAEDGDSIRLGYLVTDPSDDEVL
jgi:hypothetical protein